MNTYSVVIVDGDEQPYVRNQVEAVSIPALVGMLRHLFPDIRNWGAVAVVMISRQPQTEAS